MKNIQKQKIQSTNVNEINSESSKGEEMIKRKNVKDSPFEIITIEKESFGVMGEYRITEKHKTIAKVKEELEKITWNRIVQVIMILNEVQTKINK